MMQSKTEESKIEVTLASPQNRVFYVYIKMHMYI